MKQRTISQQMIRRILMPLVVVALSAMMLLPFFVLTVTRQQFLDEFQTAKKAINNRISNLKILSDQLEKEGVIQSWINDDSKQIEVYSSLYNITNTVSGKPYFYLSDLQDEKIVSYQPAEVKVNSIKNLVSIRQMCEGEASMILLSNGVHNSPNLAVGRGIYKDKLCVGYLIFSYYKYQIDEILQGENLFLLLNKQDRILYSSSLQFKVMDRYEIEFKIGPLVKTQGLWYLSYNDYLSVEGLQIYSLLSLSFLTKAIQSLFAFLMITIIIVIIVYKIIKKQYAKETFRMIDEMFASLANYDKMGELVPVSTSDHNLSDYIDYYNSLLIEVQNLLDKNKQLTEETTVAQIKQLQMQFNPHFLFNTLASIQVMVNKDSKSANMMIHRLAQMLRYSLRFAKENKVILNDDIEYLRDYLSLQKLRFEEYLEYVINIEDGDFLVPKLILQPIIENSILHGFSGESIFNLNITVYHIIDDLVMIVKDNGLGMSVGKLKEIQIMLERDTSDEKNVGLLNCHRRIQLMYGKECGVSIDSIEGEGTTVILRCKAERSNDA